jgi:hypothetical protein
MAESTKTMDPHEMKMREVYVDVDNLLNIRDQA